MAELSQHLKKLDTLREGIDELDTQLVELLAKRNQITTQVGQIKAEAGTQLVEPIPNRCLHLSTFRNIRGISSVGRASEWHSEGQGFKSPILHSSN